LSKEEVDRMMREADSHAEEDKKRRDDIESRNRADQAVYTAERMLRDTGEKLSAGERGAIETSIADLKKAIEGNDTAAITRAMDALTAAQHKAAETLYRQQQSGPGPGAPTGGATDSTATGSSPLGADVIDAEVVDEDKKS
jgi:molecular chaperone DnaK